MRGGDEAEGRADRTHRAQGVRGVRCGKGGKAEPGTRYKSRLHKIDNLQAAHTYCNKRKGNTPEVAKWRHPAMPPLTVADADDGRAFVLPWKPKT